MKCEEAQAVLADGNLEGASEAFERASRHAAGCAECAAAVYAVSTLRAAAARAVPRPSPRAFERAMRAATRPAAAQRQRRVGFLSGAAVGAALAATLVYAVISLWPATLPQTPAGVATPTVQLALAEVRDVAIAVYSEQPLADAEIRVSLMGEIGIDGFADQRELRWQTQLDRGINELSLPILALGEGGGQIMVAVRGGGQSRSFLVDVQTGTGEDG